MVHKVEADLLSMRWDMSPWDSFRERRCVADFVAAMVVFRASEMTVASERRESSARTVVLRLDSCFCCFLQEYTDSKFVASSSWIHMHTHTHTCHGGYTDRQAHAHPCIHPYVSNKDCHSLVHRYRALFLRDLYSTCASGVNWQGRSGHVIPSTAACHQGMQARD